MDELNLNDNTPHKTNSPTTTDITPLSSQRTSTCSSPANLPPSATPQLVSRSPLNPYLKLTVIRSPNDVIYCDDPERPGKKRKLVVGTLSAPTTQRDVTQTKGDKKTENKQDIPVPTITNVKSYARDVSNYEVPSHYIRFSHPTYEEVEDGIEYNADLEDEEWWMADEEFGPNSKAKIVWEGHEHDTLSENDNHSTNDELKNLSVEDVIAQNPKYFMSIHSTNWLIQKHRPRLPLHLFEQMMDVLEKTTGFETIITIPQAKKILVQKIPTLTELFDNKPPIIQQIRQSGISITKNPTSPLPSFAAPITLSTAITKVYTHWLNKRCRLKKPLLRRFWPPTSLLDIHPHSVFRPREKEKRKLRKKRVNDIESYRKLKSLKEDFERLKTLSELVVRRDGVMNFMMDVSHEYYLGRWREWVDTSEGQSCTIVPVLTKSIAERVLEIPQVFDDGPIVGKVSKKKRKRSSLSVLESHVASAPVAAPPATEEQKGNVVVAGHDGGLPAPSFLDPLETRRLCFADWDDGVPFVPYCENGKEVTTSRFQHRARVGRGGRIMIDRILYHSNAPKVITYGSGTSTWGYHTSTLGADGQIFNNTEGAPPNDVKNNTNDAPRAPPPESISDLLPPSLGDRVALSRRIEEKCVMGMMEDAEEETPKVPVVGLGNDVDEVLVPLDDFLDAPTGFYGEERYVIGPL